MSFLGSVEGGVDPFSQGLAPRLHKNGEKGKGAISKRKKIQKEIRGWSVGGRGRLLGGKAERKVATLLYIMNSSIILLIRAGGKKGKNSESPFRKRATGEVNTNFSKRNKEMRSKGKR